MQIQCSTYVTNGSEKIVTKMLLLNDSYAKSNTPSCSIFLTSSKELMARKSHEYNDFLCLSNSAFTDLKVFDHEVGLVTCGVFAIVLKKV